MRLRDDDKSQVGEGVEDDDDTRRRVLQVKDKRWLKKKKEEREPQRSRVPWKSVSEIRK